MKVLIETTLDGNRDFNRGELWRTLADDRPLRCIQRERRRTMANDDGQKITVLKTTWTNRLTGFFSPPLSQTYLRRTGGICAPESARGRHPEQGSNRAARIQKRLKRIIKRPIPEAAVPVDGLLGK